MGVMKQSGFDVGTRRWFKIGAASFILGTLLLIVVNILHPHQADPNNNPAVFAEYAADTRWVATHLMQLFGTLLFMVPGFLSVYAALENQGSGTKGLARLGLAMSLLTFAVYAVDMGIDGIALKKAVDRWAAATGSEQAIYFGVAEGIRWLENGVLGIAATLQGLVILLLALAMTTGSVFTKWLGWLGTLGGGAFFIGGFALLYGGFSAIAGTLGSLGFLAILVWVFGAAYHLWRLS